MSWPISYFVGKKRVKLVQPDEPQHNSMLNSVKDVFLHWWTLRILKKSIRGKLVKRRKKLFLPCTVPEWSLHRSFRHAVNSANRPYFVQRKFMCEHKCLRNFSVESLEKSDVRTQQVASTRHRYQNEKTKRKEISPGVTHEPTKISREYVVIRLWCLCVVKKITLSELILCGCGWGLAVQSQSSICMPKCPWARCWTPNCPSQKKNAVNTLYKCVCEWVNGKLSYKVLWVVIKTRKAKILCLCLLSTSNDLLLLWTHLCREPPATLCMCEWQTLGKLRTTSRSCLKMAISGGCGSRERVIH